MITEETQQVEKVKRAMAQPKESFRVGEIILCKGHTFAVKQISHKQMKLKLLEGRLR